MTEQEIRTIIVDALEYANILSINEDSLLAFFVDGSEDVSLEQLDIDSLAAMELCIALEINAGVSIVPEDLQKMGTLNRLVTTVRNQLK